MTGLDLLVLVGFCWLAALAVMWLALYPPWGDDDDDDEPEPDYEPVPDDEVEKPDAWGRDPDWNWPRGWGDRRA